MNETLPIWLDIDDALAFSGISRHALYRLVNDRRVKTMTSGKRRFFSRRSLEELEDGYSAAPTFPHVRPLRGAGTNQR